MAAIGATVWTVLAILADTGAVTNALIFASTLLWAGGFLVVARLNGLFFAPRRAQNRQ
ncbi:hypothetical protein [Arthrobacter alpinus]|uniref:hypothetical protein n=1 Tax=Arthrobacter alpinus TaxID=656366 RepID=UPI000B106D15|nr:hypothetical protein [Arthrobacter alpinus]